MQCVVTSSIDSACGVLAAAHLAAALDNGLAHGLATSSWLTADTGTPPTITNGRLALPDTPGLGFVADNTLDFSGMGQELDIS
jgi:L-alanine-DL-glutamate epimerase-like enolase superfamily enzyme